MSLRLTPVKLSEAKDFVRRHHRHNDAPLSWLFGVGVEKDGELVAVGIAGRPVARGLDDGYTVEIARIASTGARNACSMLYGALSRAAFALGYRRVVTYTLQAEPGSSLRAAGPRHEDAFKEENARAGAQADADAVVATMNRAELFAELWEAAAATCADFAGDKHPNLEWLREALAKLEAAP